MSNTSFTSLGTTLKPISSFLCLEVLDPIQSKNAKIYLVTSSSPPLTQSPYASFKLVATSCSKYLWLFHGGSTTYHNPPWAFAHSKPLRFFFFFISNKKICLGIIKSQEVQKLCRINEYTTWFPCTHIMVDLMCIYNNHTYLYTMYPRLLWSTPPKLQMSMQCSLYHNICNNKIHKQS